MLPAINIDAACYLLLLRVLVVVWQDKIGTMNEIVLESVKTNEPVGYKHAEKAGVARPKTDAEKRCETLTKALEQAAEENTQLKTRIKELELRVSELESNSKLRSSISEAKVLDAAVNGDAGAGGEAGEGGA